MTAKATDAAHRLRSYSLLLETVLVFLGLALLSYQSTLSSSSGAGTAFWTPLWVALQGAWFHRLYVVAHEASHRKLFPRRKVANDAWGQVLLLPILLPLRIHRKIHAFHHAHNRRDHHTSALEIVPLTRPLTPLRRLGHQLLWFIAVFCGGHFFHGLISVMLFLWLPIQWAKRIHPAFHGWTQQDRRWSILSFGVALLFHIAVYRIAGAQLWWILLGAPLLVFAWVYSLLVYIYHYQTSVGPEVQFNVRSLRPHPLMSWWLLNFNEHSTHHRNPKLPWYDLPRHARPLPASYASNQKVDTIFQAICLQFQGAQFIESDHDKP